MIRNAVVRRHSLASSVWEDCKRDPCLVISKKTLKIESYNNIVITYFIPIRIPWNRYMDAKEGLGLFGGKREGPDV